mgnify:CR=1 FL=1
MRHPQLEYRNLHWTLLLLQYPGLRKQPGREALTQRSAKPTGRPILRPAGGHFPIYLGLGVYGHGVCVCTLFIEGFSCICVNVNVDS